MRRQLYRRGFSEVSFAIQSCSAMGDLQAALKTLHDILPESLRKPQYGIVCGSGLSTLVESLTDVVKVPYLSLDGFVNSTGKDLPSCVSLSHLTGIFTVAGHKSVLAFGFISGVPVVAMLGRVRVTYSKLHNKC